jgi:hypothetical protein
VFVWVDGFGSPLGEGFPVLFVLRQVGGGIGCTAGEMLVFSFLRVLSCSFCLRSSVLTDLGVWCFGFLFSGVWGVWGYSCFLLLASCCLLPASCFLLLAACCLLPPSLTLTRAITVKLSLRSSFWMWTSPSKRQAGTHTAQAFRLGVYALHGINIKK